MEKPKIYLTEQELRTALNSGLDRRVEQLKHNAARDLHATDMGPWETDFQAAAAEMAVARYLNTYWDGGLNSFKAADVAGNIQVRWSPRYNACLIIRPNDRPDHNYVLVTGSIPVFSICGWVSGESARSLVQPSTKGGGPPAWFVPQDKLRPIAGLGVAG
jgi:hypothetical protein